MPEASPGEEPSSVLVTDGYAAPAQGGLPLPIA